MNNRRESVIAIEGPLGLVAQFCRKILLSVNVSDRPFSLEDHSQVLGTEIVEKIATKIVVCLYLNALVSRSPNKAIFRFEKILATVHTNVVFSYCLSQQI